MRLVNKISSFIRLEIGSVVENSMPNVNDHRQYDNTWSVRAQFDPEHFKFLSLHIQQSALRWNF